MPIRHWAGGTLMNNPSSADQVSAKRTKPGLWRWRVAVPTADAIYAKHDTTGTIVRLLPRAVNFCIVRSSAARRPVPLASEHRL